ncbi:MAG: DUF2975 domain-containing protein [Oscillospiraceae bacterium]
MHCRGKHFCFVLSNEIPTLIYYFPEYQGIVPFAVCILCGIAAMVILMAVHFIAILLHIAQKAPFSLRNETFLKRIALFSAFAVLLCLVLFAFLYITGAINAGVIIILFIAILAGSMVCVACTLASRLVPQARENC